MLPRLWLLGFRICLGAHLFFRFLPHSPFSFAFRFRHLFMSTIFAGTRRGFWGLRWVRLHSGNVSGAAAELIELVDYLRFLDLVKFHRSCEIIRFHYSCAHYRGEHTKTVRAPVCEATQSF